MENGQKSVFQLFNGDKHFKVPYYQRSYAWTEKHLKDFLEDIVFQVKDKEYFLGTILFQDYGVKDGFEQIDIVDGQQRITTLIIFMKVLLDLLSTKDVGQDYSRDIRTYLKDKEYYKLELIDTDDEFFKTYIIDANQLDEDFLRTPSQHRLDFARKFFAKELQPYNIDILKELKKKIENTKLLTYSVNDTAEATLIFETTNDRGKSLTNLEKTKSFIMHKIYLTRKKPSEVLKLIQDRFSEIYRILEEIDYKENEDGILQYHFICHFDWSYSQKTKDYQKYMEKFKSKINYMLKSTESENVPTFINNYSRELKETFGVVRKVLNDKNRNLRDIFLLERVALFFPLIIKCYKYDRSEDKRDYYDVIKLLEIFSFRIYGVARKPAYTARDWLYALARDFSGDFNKLKYELRERILDYVSDKLFKEKLLSPYLYHDLSKLDLKYLFWKYENYLRKIEQPIASEMGEDEFTTQNPRFKLTIEHIASQNPKVSTDNLKLPELTEEFQDSFLHNLGNLTFDPNSANASKGNLGVETKISKYFIKAPFKTQNELEEFIDQGGWSEESINKRAKKILSFAMEEWNPRQIAGDESLKFTVEDENEINEVSPHKAMHREILKFVISLLNDNFFDLTIKFNPSNKKAFKLYQQRNGYLTSAYADWLHGQEQLHLGCGLWKDQDDDPFKFYVEVYSDRDSEKLSYRFTNAKIVDILNRNDYDDYSEDEGKPYFMKEIILRDVAKEPISRLAISEMQKIKPVIEQLLSE